jgi:hypothetical protein
MGFIIEYPQGFERDEGASEGDTQWVRNKTGHFSSPSMPWEKPARQSARLGGLWYTGRQSRSQNENSG